MKRLKSFLLAQPKVVLPLMMFFGVLIVGARLNDMWDSLSTGKVFAPVTTAQAADPAPPAAAPQPAPAAPTPQAAATPPAPAAPAPPPPSSLTSDEASSSEMDLVKQLSQRRDQLEQRSKALDTRDALIRVAEQRVDQKIKEMETLRAQLQVLVNQGNAAQQAQLDNLVKIYETMKPKEASRIFETLDMTVLLGVVQKMKPQRMAAIMAEMDPNKAKELTVALTKQDQLPQIK